MKRRIAAVSILVALAGLLLAACAPTEQQMIETPDATVAAGNLEALVREDLAERLGLTVDDVAVESVVEAELSSADLGCPPADAATDKTQPAMVMGQELTLVVDGKRYLYHGYAMRVAYCGEVDAVEAAPGAPGGDEEKAIIEALDTLGREILTQARTELADQLGIPAEQISVVQGEAMRWSDSSLGCPEPGKMYAQAITPGYQIILEHDGQQFDYRANEQGYLKRCEAAQ